MSLADRPEPDQARALLRQAGLETGEHVGCGVEGHVFALDDRVVKMWFDTTKLRLERLGAFYDALDQSATFRSSRILDIRPVGGLWATIEKRVTGRPLAPAWTGLPRTVAPDVGRTLIDVLDALRRVPHDPALTVLPALAGEPPLAPPFPAALADLVRRRGAAFGGALVAELGGGLPELVERTARDVEAIEPATTGLVHGDLVPPNILVAPGLEPAVLDFGFLTTHGDPDFDVAVASCIFDMYGPSAEEITQQLTEMFVTHFGTSPRTMALYRSAYAIVTACCFGDSATDGHFTWCTNLLRSQELA